MARLHLLTSAALLLLPTLALAQERSYELEARPYFGGDAFQGELRTERQSNGTYRVQHKLRFAGEDWGPTARGTGRWSGSTLVVRFQAVSGIDGKLKALIESDGRLTPPQDSMGFYRVSSGGHLSGSLRIHDGQRLLWIREQGEQVVDYLTRVPDRAAFERLSRRDNVPGAMGVREVKFLVAGVDTPNPTLYFVNTKRFQYHYDFATGALGVQLTLAQFNGQTYFTDHRRFMAGTLIAHDSYEHPVTGKGIYTLEFWPTDPVKAEHVATAYHLALAGMPFAAARLYYHPLGETHEQIYRDQRPVFDQRQVRAIGTQDLFGNVSFSALNPGEGYGVLRLMDGSDNRPATVRDVVIFKTLPNDLTHVAGVITELPQTPLSHVNLKARQNGTPNAYIKGASDEAGIKALLGKLVHYVVRDDGYTLEAADPAGAAAWMDRIRPKDPQVPTRDLSVTTVKPLRDLGAASASAVGAKAANLAELRKLLGTSKVPDGFAVPFAFYDAFFRHNGLYDAARAMMADPAFQQDPAARERALRDLRRRVRRGAFPPGMEQQLAALQASFPAGTALRCRSSTNNEDLEGFNGAGLYDSHTHRPDEGPLGETIKQVWADLWTYRAFEEREFYRIDHSAAAMGVLVHPNFDDELANGVAVTKNIYDPNWPGFYVNVQVGESLVTNPTAGATPDELLIAALGPNGEYETQYIQHTNQALPPGRRTILTAAQVQELTRAMERIQRHFKQVYHAQQDKSFAMDIEFKIDVSGKLVIKQARPWVD
ncbi:MAG: PEP/pyruvate-binding domain-containing protein [Planctomycetota bacterium]